MALNFPDNPTLNDTVELGGKTYQWDGVKWRMVYVITPTPPTPSATAPSITVVSTSPTGVTFTLTNNDDNTAIVSYGISTTRGAVELAASATSSNITVDLAAGTYTLTAYATVVGEVATSATASVEIVVPQYELLYSETVATAKTQIDITGLNIGKDDGLELVFTTVGIDATSTSIFLYANGNTTSTNYDRQQLAFGNTVISSGRSSDSRISLVQSGRKSQGISKIKISNNDKFVVQNSEQTFIGSQTASAEVLLNNIVGTDFTLTSITSLSLIANRTNGIGVGSKIALYKVNGGAA